MDFNQYQDEASKTAFASPKLFLRTDSGHMLEVPYAYSAIGLGEAGEAQNKIKKILRDSDGVVTGAIREAIKGELGGLLWYMSQVAANLDIKFNDVAEYNIVQLRDRQARGVLKGSGDNR